MITRDNLTEVIKSLNAKQRRRLERTNKEYCVIYLHISNGGFRATIRLTNDFARYQNVSNNGDCILETEEVLTILND